MARGLSVAARADKGEARRTMTGDQALRLIGRIACGDYTSGGTRTVIDGTARFHAVDGNSLVHGGGFGYYKQFGRTSLNGSAEVLGVNQTVERFAETGEAGWTCSGSTVSAATAGSVA